LIFVLQNINVCRKAYALEDAPKPIIDKHGERQSIMGEFDFVSLVGIFLIIYGGLSD